MEDKVFHGLIEIRFNLSRKNEKVNDVCHATSFGNAKALKGSPLISTLTSNSIDQFINQYTILNKRFFKFGFQGEACLLQNFH